MKCVHFVGLHCNNCITMHRMENINCINIIPTNTLISTTYAKDHHSSTYKTPSTTPCKNKIFNNTEKNLPLFICLLLLTFSIPENYNAVNDRHK